MASGVLRVCALYPDLMNIYADRGNLLLLEREARAAGLQPERTRRIPPTTDHVGSVVVMLRG